MPSTALAKRPHRTRGQAILHTATAPARGLKALSRMLFTRSGGFVWRFLPNTRFDYSREVGDGLGSSVIMAPVLWIARTFPEAPIVVLDSDNAPVEGHPMVRKLRRPNPHYSGMAMWMGVLISLILDGNGYLIKIRNRAGTGVSELWYVPHWLMEPKSDSENVFIEYYQYSPNGVAQRVEIEDVVHFRYGLDPADTRKGLSPLASVLREVFTDDEAANFSASILRNAGVPGIVMSPHPSAPSVGPNDAQAMKNDIMERRGDRRGEPIIVPGAVEVHEFGFSPQQLVLKDLRQIPEERVTAAIGVPAVVVGLGAGLARSTFSNMAEAREAAYESCLIPLQRLIDEELWHQLLPDYEDDPDAFTVGHDLKNVRVLQEDRVREANRLSVMFKAGMITRKYALETLGEEATPADDVYAIPGGVTLVPAGEMMMLPAPQDDGSDSGSGGSGDDGSGSGSGEDDTTPPKGRRARLKAQTAAQRRVVDALGRIGATLETVLAEELETDFNALGQLAREAFLDERDSDGQRLSAMVASRTKADPPDEEAVANRVLRALGLGQWLATVLRPRLELHYQRTVRETSRVLRRVAGLNVLIPNIVERQIITMGGRRAGLIDIEDQTREAIMRAIRDGREQAEGPIQIADRIRGEVGSGRFVNAGPRYRSRLIARTETKFAQNLSALETYRASPVVSRVMAFDGLGPGDTDEMCEQRNGREFTFDEAELEMTLTHPQCTLSFGPVTVTDVLAGGL